jgi:hypothetical protein
VRDRPDLPQAHFAVGRKVRLAARDAAAGGIEQSEPERGDRARVGPALEVRALVVADRAVEVEAEVGAAVERVGRRVGIGLGRAQRGDSVSVARASSGVAKNR